MAAREKHFIDLHIHSRFSRATSPLLEPGNLSRWARLKGLSLLGTGDMTHPGWLAELKENLTSGDDGFYGLKGEAGGPRFVPTGEVSCIYKQDGRTRKIHLVVIAPNLELAEKFSQSLGARGNVTSDGRPILGLSAKQILEIALSLNEKFIVAPAHIWTPWFSLFGSKSGFDQVEECFGDLSGHITALETGLSSDPDMNRLISALDSYALISSSDAHSLDKLGREATILNGELSWNNLAEALKGGPSLGGTLEFFPEEGKYHLDGHADCGPALWPSQSRELKGLCPICGKPLTIGVLSRVMELADRDRPENKNLPDQHLVPLAELLGQCLKVGPKSKKVSEGYGRLMDIFKNEINLLLNAPLEEIDREAGLLLGRAIRNMREGKVEAKGGFDGQYGTITALSGADFEELSRQSRLFVTAKPEKPQKRSLPEAAPKEAPPPKAKEPEANFPFFNQVDLILDGLDARQMEAVKSPAARLLISAGPGSGKTRVLLHRAAWLLRERRLDPAKILITTFTKKAAESLRPRLRGVLPFREDAEQVHIKTLHALALEIIKRPGWRLAPEEALEKLVRDSARKTELSAKNWALKLSSIKNRWPQNMFSVPLEYREAFALYQKGLERQKLWDFDDLILDALGLAESPGYDAVLVDEFQDLSPSQLALVQKLAPAENGNIFLTAIGDPDQSIYGFRGAGQDFDGLTDFEKAWLSTNYRSCRNIVAAGEAFMKKNLPGRRSRRRAAQSLAGPKITRTVYPNPKLEAKGLALTVAGLLGVLDLGAGGMGLKDSRAVGDLDFSDIAVLFRLKSQGEAVARVLSEMGLPWQMSGQEEVTATDNLNFQADKISLLSMHAAKGLEFKIVFIIGLEDGLCPYRHQGLDLNEKELAEEKRLFYVALTRAKERLYLSAASERFIFGQKSQGLISPFWKSLPKSLCQDVTYKNKKIIKKKQPGLFDL